MNYRLSYAHVFASYLTYNRILPIWKTAEVILVQKSGRDPEQLTSYRPISLILVFLKVLERVIHIILNEVTTSFRTTNLAPEINIQPWNTHPLVRRDQPLLRKKGLLFGRLSTVIPNFRSSLARRSGHEIKEHFGNTRRLPARQALSWEPEKRDLRYSSHPYRTTSGSRFLFSFIPETYRISLTE